MKKQGSTMNTLNDINNQNEDSKQNYVNSTVDNHKYWQYNTLLLYNVIMIYTCEWPSLFIEWVPSICRGDEGVYSQDLILGSYTTEKNNYILILEVSLPSEQLSHSNLYYEKISDYRHICNDTSKNFKMKNKIYHECEINKISCSPQNKDVIACFSSDGNINILNLNNYKYEESEPKNNSVVTFDYTLKGHLYQGWGIQWGVENNLISSCADDSYLCIWDINSSATYTTNSTNVNNTPTASGSFNACSISAASATGAGAGAAGGVGGFSGSVGMLGNANNSGVNSITINSGGDLNVMNSNSASSKGGGGGSGGVVHPLIKFFNDNVPLQDCCWKDNNVLTVSDNGHINIYDIRNKSAVSSIKATSCTLNSIDVNPHNKNIFATGGTNKEIDLWDIRFTNKSLHRIISHKETIIKLQWDKYQPGILSSSSSDKYIYFFDTNKIGIEQTYEDSQDGPPELIFIHGGHASNILDFSLNSSYSMMISSISEDNTLHIWQPSRQAYEDASDTYDDTEVE
ncbi:chromatin assembly factor 1 P55 subunit [Plasmodium gonderi]|uniref:Chromatin assembly factor 1 P55 subunit n=1 Tax=Plasmodium gonderi TaxID=77519 RepID=A0A1Y1JR01_PLAGO|nr:chromatin assembly factor 1 P55 subunit [Plasmodium gonderi]GAW82903.1 chromatin assembly factor 1 P55 subunit [Plasmodium gonderi]